MRTMNLAPAAVFLSFAFPILTASVAMANDSQAMSAGSAAPAPAGAENASVRVAQAASATPADAPPDNNTRHVEQLQEVLVTAQKRTESLQNVPISVSVLSADQLSAEQISTVADLSHLAPSLNYMNQPAFLGNASFSLRGIGAYAPQPGFQPAIGIVVDDVPLARQVEFNSGLSDVTNIQVLTGPQGTLFGTSTTAGVVIITTKDPTDHLDGYVEGSATNDNEFIARLAAGGPITDRVRARVSLYSRDLGSYIKNIDPGVGDGGNERDIGARLKVEFLLSDAVNLKLGADYSDTKVLPVDQIYISDSQNLLVTMGNGDPVLGQHVIDDPRLVNTRERSSGQQELEDYGFSANLSWDMGNGYALKSISSYRHFNLDAFEIGVQTPATFLDPQDNPLVLGHNSNVALRPINDPQFTQGVKYFTQELRLSRSSSSLDWILGAFYTHNNEFLIGGVPILVMLAPNFYAFFTQPRHADIYLNSASAFADATWHISQAIDVFGGVRLTHEKLSDDYLIRNYFVLPGSYTVDANNDAFVNPGVPPIGTNAFSAHTSDKEWSGRAGVKWNINPNVNVYATVSRGFTGASTDTSERAQASSAFLLPSIETSYELGLKSTFLDHRLIFNTTLFSALVRDLQVNRQVPTPTGIIEEASNVGALKSNGLEQTITALIGQRLSLSANASILRNKLTDGPLLQACYRDQTAAEGCNVAEGASTLQDVTGKPGLQAPRLKYNVFGRYDIPMASLPFNLYVTSSYTYQSRVEFSLAYDPIATTQAAYGLLDAAIGLVSKDNRYEVSLFGKNVLDKDFAVIREEANAPGLGRATGFWSRDSKAYYGIKASVNF
jgi:iron complex outermembrane recepter protein